LPGFNLMFLIYFDWPKLNTIANEIANRFADNAFDSLDVNYDGRPNLNVFYSTFYVNSFYLTRFEGLLSFAEFKKFALSEPKITASLNGFDKEVGKKRKHCPLISTPLQYCTSSINLCIITNQSLLLFLSKYTIFFYFYFKF